MADRANVLPLISIAIEPKATTDQGTLGVSLQRLASEDPSFRVTTDRETKQTIISGMSDRHLEIIVDRLLGEFKVDVNVGKPHVAYKETIRRSAEHETKFVRQTGGRSQYGHVVLRVEPLDARNGFEFVDGTKSGVVPREYVLAIENGVHDATEGGVLAGYPVIDVKVTLLDGSYHEVDSSKMAFKIAGSMAFKEAARKANPVILEPLMSVEVVVPEEFSGPVCGDLNGRQGRIHGMDHHAGTMVIAATVPLSEMLGYAPALRSMTQGRATYTMEFSAYVEVNPLPDPDGNEPASMALRVA